MQIGFMKLFLIRKLAGSLSRNYECQKRKIFEDQPVAILKRNATLLCAERPSMDLWFG